MIHILSTGFDSEGTPLVTGETTCPKGHKWLWEAYHLQSTIITTCTQCQAEEETHD